MQGNIVVIHQFFFKKLMKKENTNRNNILVIHKFFFKKLMKEKNKNLNELG